MFKNPFFSAATLTCITILLANLAGCSGYQMGNRTLYDTEIKTVYVPMVEANTYRNALGERLTESICKRITDRTPFQLAGPMDADSELSVQLVSETQNISALNAYNDTRQKNLSWKILVVWRDRRDNVVTDIMTIPLTEKGITINAQGYLVAEMGQSSATAQQDLIDNIADQIVSIMETPW